MSGVSDIIAKKKISDDLYISLEYDYETRGEQNGPYNGDFLNSTGFDATYYYITLYNSKDEDYIGSVAIWRYKGAGGVELKTIPSEVREEWETCIRNKSKIFLIGIEKYKKQKDIARDLKIKK